MREDKGESPARCIGAESKIDRTGVMIHSRILNRNSWRIILAYACTPITSVKSA